MRLKELIIEDRFGFKSMFRMSLEDFEIVLGHIQDLITPQEIIGGARPILADERLVLTIRFLATGETFCSLSFQFRISKAAVSYIVAGCCDAIVERMVPIFYLLRPMSGLKLLIVLKVDGIFCMHWGLLMASMLRLGSQHIFFFFFKFRFWSNVSNISSNTEIFLCWMKCSTRLT